jgi:hypothetical protein
VRQPRDTGLGKDRSRLIERGARKAKGGGGLTHGSPFDLDPAEHLVLDLGQIARVEELVAGEQGIGNRIGMGMQRTLRAQGVDFRIGARSRGHGRLL